MTEEGQFVQVDVSSTVFYQPPIRTFNDVPSIVLYDSSDQTLK